MTSSPETLTTSGKGDQPGGREPVSVPARDSVPVRAQGLELLGRVEGSGHREARYLARRVDGQTIQITPLLYRLLEEIDGRRRFDEIATAVSARIGKRATGEDLQALADRKLRPLGLLRHPDGSEPAVKKLNPLLGIRPRLVVSRPDLTRRLTDPFANLFRPSVVVAVVVAFVVSNAWLLFDKGLASGARQLFFEPWFGILVLALTFASAGFHEFGHAAACRYGGATPGAMGAGLYLVWPVFYTDVTDAYRLSRRGRLRVDLGGLYFNAVFAVAMFGVWTVTRWDALLVLLPIQLFQMVHQLLPLVRFDGSRFRRSRNYCALWKMIPSASRRPECTVLTPWRMATRLGPRAPGTGR